MGIETIICFMLAIIFGLLSSIFGILKGSGAMLISGFSNISKENREKFNKERMSLDMKNSLFIWVVILLLGGVGSYFISKYFAYIAIVIWIILFFKDVHIDPNKAFNKYKKNKK